MATTAVFEANRQLNEKEFAERKIVLESLPRHLGVVPTTRCNLDCIMCGRPADNRVLPYEVAQKIKELFPFLERLNWQGGEVFLADYFEELVLSAGEYPQIEQDINTSGLLITPRWAEVLAKVNMRTVFSIDGVSKETYEYIRRPARFEKLLECLSNVREAMARHGRSKRMVLTVVVMRSNYRQLERFVDFAKEQGFHAVYLNPIRLGTTEEHIFFHKDRAVFEHLREALPRCQSKARELGIELYSRLPSLVTDGPDGTGQTESPKSSRSVASQILCRKPWKKLFVDVSRDGGVYPECFCAVSAGSLVTESFRDIWNGATMQDYRRRLLTGEVNDFCDTACTSGQVAPEYLLE